MKWYRKAAEQNDAPAQYDLGLCYANGEGVAKDYVEAYRHINGGRLQLIRIMMMQKSILSFYKGA